MMLQGQPYYGSTSTFDPEHSSREKLFIDAINYEGKLKFDLAKNNYLQLLSYANENKDIDGKILFEYHMCRLLNRQTQYQQASVYCEALHEDINNAVSSVLPKYVALRIVANNQEFVGNYDEALITYKELLSIIPVFEDASGVYNDAGLLLKTLGNYDQAKEYISIALKMRENSPLPLLKAQTYHSMGAVLFETGDYQNAFDHFMQSKIIVEQYQYPYGLMHAQLGLGKAMIAMKKFEDGIAHLLGGIETATQQGNSKLRGDIYLTLAEAYRIQNKYSVANDYANQAFELGSSIESERLIGSSLKVLASIAESQEEYGLALDYYQKYANSELARRNMRHQSAYIELETARKDHSDTKQESKLVTTIQENKKNIASLKEKTQIYQILLAVLAALLPALWYLRKIEIARVELDSLTGLLSRAAAIRKIKKQPELCSHHLNHVIILLDLDDFKRINDTYGHPTGDRALIHVANILQKELSVGEICGRLGGEEFILLLRNVDDLDIRDRVEHLHYVIAHQTFIAEDNTPLTITASFSFLATYKALSDFDALYSILDQALYQAKKNGKNCIVDAFNDPILFPPAAYESTQS
ncbi:GGDEF domain-containing protein [Vibrio sinensis]|nr:GGDEF domain-containing protein [Vibrio sinensis]